MTPAGLSLLKACEGCRLTAYQDQRGIWTIGYGHTGSDVTPDLVWTQDQAEAALAADVNERETAVVDLVTADLSGNELSALISLAYNIGLTAFRGSSALSYANANAYSLVPQHIALWNKTVIDGALATDPGLVWRRACEVALWNLPDDAAIPDWESFR